MLSACTPTARPTGSGPRVAPLQEESADDGVASVRSLFHADEASENGAVPS